MGIEFNKKDFENAIEAMGEVIAALDCCVNEGFMDILKKVVQEYDGHYKADIEELIDKCSELEDKIEELKADD